MNAFFFCCIKCDVWFYAWSWANYTEFWLWGKNILWLIADAFAYNAGSSESGKFHEATTTAAAAILLPLLSFNCMARENHEVFRPLAVNDTNIRIKINKTLAFNHLDGLLHFTPFEYVCKTFKWLTHFGSKCKWKKQKSKSYEKRNAKSTQTRRPNQQSNI